jgi:NADPH-dependent 2,4-dienoyl-CoA reductase/sulfur reductase-like enzyme
MRFLIIGGSDAGVAAGLRSHELDPSWEITLVLADEFPNYSICGLPFYLSGETPDWHSLAHCTEFPGINLLPNHRAVSIDAKAKTVQARSADGIQKELGYDKLLIGTGARPVRPSIDSLELPGVFPLHTMEDSFALHRFFEEHEPKSAVIVGAGYIGLEMADALTHRGIHVTLASRTESILATVDPSIGQRVEAEMRKHGVEVCNHVEVSAIRSSGEQLTVSGTSGFEATADLVLVAVGVRPNSELGVAAGIATGAKGALQVNRLMETNLPDVYAAGDCVETWHRLLNRNTYMPLGTTAHKQGRIAAENALGYTREFAGSLGTQVVKLFDLVAARTGSRHDQAQKAGFDPFTVETTVWDHKAYYPGAHELHLRVTGDRKTGKLLGAQLLGHKQSEVSKRVDVYATALFHRMDVEELNDLDLSYTPPLSSPWDPIQMAAQAYSVRLAESHPITEAIPRATVKSQTQNLPNL